MADDKPELKDLPDFSDEVGDAKDRALKVKVPGLGDAYMPWGDMPMEQRERYRAAAEGTRKGDHIELRGSNGESIVVPLTAFDEGEKRDKIRSAQQRKDFVRAVHGDEVFLPGGSQLGKVGRAASEEATSSTPAKLGRAAGKDYRWKKASTRVRTRAGERPRRHASGFT